MEENTAGDGVEGTADKPAEADREAAEADHELVMATARRIIIRDAAIIHRLGTV